MNAVENADPQALPPGLLARAQSGDAHAFCELCESCESRLKAHAIMLCQNVETAKDLAQETFIEAWKNLRRYRGESRFYTWLCAILLNRYRNLLRRKRPFLFSFLSAEENQAVNDTIDEAEMPDERADRKERAELIATLLGRLPSRQRDVIFLRFYVDDSLESIAAATGVSVGTVKSRLFYALEALRGMAELKQFLEDDCL